MSHRWCHHSGLCRRQGQGLHRRMPGRLHLRGPGRRNPWPRRVI